jgi:hypothetical protein
MKFLGLVLDDMWAILKQKLFYGGNAKSRIPAVIATYSFDLLHNYSPIFFCFEDTSNAPKAKRQDQNCVTGETQSKLFLNGFGSSVAAPSQPVALQKCSQGGPCERCDDMASPIFSLFSEI